MKSRIFTALFVGAAVFGGISVGASAQSGAPAAADDQRIPTAVFGRLANMSGVRISPDGTRLAYGLTARGTTALAWLDLSEPDPKPKVIATAGEFREIGDRTIASWRWVGNDNVVITLASREDAFGQRGDVTRLFSHNVKTGKSLPLAWDGAFFAAAGILDVDHEKGRILLQRQTNRSGTERLGNPEVLRVDVNTGRTEIVMAQNPVVGGWAADANGVVRAGFGGNRDSGKERILYRQNADGTMKTVIKQVDKDFTGAGIRPLLFLDEPNMAYVSSNHEGVSKIYKVDMTKMELGKPVFERKGYDADGILSNFENNDIVGFIATEDRSKYFWTDGRYREVQKFLDEGFGAGNAQIVSVNRSAERFVIAVGAPNQPGAYYLYDTVSGSFKRVGWRNHALQDRKLNPVSTIRYRASDGEMIPAVLTMPRHRAGRKNLPVVMITHGGPFGVRDEERYDSWSQAMAELGYVVVQPNYRGSGGYGADWVKKGRNDGFGLRMQDDLNDAITHLAAQGVVDPKRACMMGWSYGGYASARAAQRDPDKWRCTIAGAGVYDLPAMRAYDQDYLGSFGANYLAKGAADLRSVSPTHNAKGKWAPILVVHGVRDQRVPVAQGRGLVSALRGSGKKKGVDYDYIEQPKNTHNLPYDDVSIEWLEGAERWLTQHNPAYVASDPDKPKPVATAMK